MSTGYIWLAIAIIFNIAAQFLLKLGAQNAESSKIENVDIVTKITGILGNPMFIAALVFYGLAFITYFFSLSKIELSKAYPLVSISVLIFIFLGSVFFLQENINTSKIIGVALCIAGITLIYLKG